MTENSFINQFAVEGSIAEEGFFQSFFTADASELPVTADVSHLRTSCWHQVASLIVQHATANEFTIRRSLSRTLNVDTNTPILALNQKKVLTELGFEALYAPLPLKQDSTGKIIGTAQKRVFTSDMLQEDLQKGPLYVAGNFADGLAHVICVTDIQKDTVFYRDPAFLEKKEKQLGFTMSLKEFNDKISQSASPAVYAFNLDRKELSKSPHFKTIS